LTVTAMIGAAATDGEDEALTDALDGASTIQNRGLEEMRLVRGSTRSGGERGGRGAVV
jgi:hypothetical protein